MAAVLPAALLLFLAASARASQPDTRLRQYAHIAGTVFSDTGSALRGAQVRLIPDPRGARKNKAKKAEAISGSRGEFAFRVPAAEGRYTVRVKRVGFDSAEKVITVTSDERIDVTFQPAPAKM